MFKIFASFIRKSPKLSFTFAMMITIVAIIAARYAEIPLLVGFLFAGSLLSWSNIIGYMIGHIPFSRDTVWHSFKKKYEDEEEAEEKYKEHTLKVASITYPIMILLFIAWVIIEIVALFRDFGIL